MKNGKLFSILLFLFLTLFTVSPNIFGIGDRSVTAALRTLTAELEKMPEDITTAAIVIPEELPEKHLNRAHLISTIQDSVIESRIALIDRSSIEDTIKEIKLGASGLLDTESVMEAGRMAGVDAFLFITAEVSGPFNNRLIISLKGVEVTTGAVVFIEEYTYEEPALFTPYVAISYLVFNGYSASTTVTINNETEKDFSKTSSGSSFPIFMDLLGLTLTLPEARLGFTAGFCNFYADTASGFKAEDIYVSDYKYQDVSIGGLSTALYGFLPFVDVTIPISWYLGDNGDRLRLTLGTALAVFEETCGTAFTPHKDEDFDNNPIDDYVLDEKLDENTTTVKFLIRTKLELKLLSTLSAILNFNFFLPSETKSNEYKGVQLIHSWEFSPMIGIGLKYSLF
jgi:hypothetical protein